MRVLAHWFAFTASLLVVAIAQADDREWALTDELREKVSIWRTKHLPAKAPESYWDDLKELGAQVGEAGARRIVQAGAVDPDSAIALMAYHAWKEFEKIEELGALYGVTVDRVAREWLGDLDDEGWAARQERIAANLRARPRQQDVENLREKHKTPEYVRAWEAWLLFPVFVGEQGRNQPRRLMRHNLSMALNSSGDPRTVALLVELCRVLPAQPSSLWALAQHGKRTFDEVIESDSMDIHRIVHQIGGEAAVRGKVELLRIAEDQGYAGEGEDSVRQQFIYRLSSSWNPRVLRESRRLLDPDVPGSALDESGSLRPTDNRWREYKPIIEGLLSGEEALSEDVVRFLRDALAAMPETSGN